MVKSIAQAAAMIEAICRHSDNRKSLLRFEARIKATGLKTAIARQDTAYLYDRLISSFSFQGISNANAASYIEAHGNAGWKAIKGHLKRSPPGCPKLETFAAYKDCGYRKTAQTCSQRMLMADCLVPSLPVRKGDLNQLAMSLFLFIRDIARGNLVRFLDRTLIAAMDDVGGNRQAMAAVGRKALVRSLRIPTKSPGHTDLISPGIPR